MFPTSMSQVSHPEVLWHKWIGLVESPQTYGDSGLSRIGSKDVESPLLFPSHRQLEPDPKSPASPGNRITTQFKNGFGKPSNMAFSGFQRLSAFRTLGYCHCMSLHVIACHCNHVRVSQTFVVTVAMSLVGNTGNTLLVALVPCQFWMMRCIWDRSLEEIQMAALSTEAITMPEAMRRSFDSTPNSKNLVRSSEKVYEDGINRINRINPMHLSSDV